MRTHLSTARYPPIAGFRLPSTRDGLPPDQSAPTFGRRDDAGVRRVGFVAQRFEIDAGIACRIGRIRQKRYRLFVDGGTRAASRPEMKAGK